MDRVIWESLIFGWAKRVELQISKALVQSRARNGEIIWVGQAGCH